MKTTIRNVALRARDAVRRGKQKRRLDRLSDDASRLAVLLTEHGTEHVPLRVRDVHLLADIRQGDVLKALKELQDEGFIRVEEEMHDPLASRIRMDS